MSHWLLTPNTCGGNMAIACPRTGLLARRPVAQVVPQQWLTHTIAPGVVSDDRRRLDMVIYGVTRWGGALCRDAT